jgi:hypothetical protein
MSHDFDVLSLKSREDHTAEFRGDSEKETRSVRKRKENKSVKTIVSPINQCQIYTDPTIDRRIKINRFASRVMGSFCGVNDHAGYVRQRARWSELVVIGTDRR